MKSSIWFDFLKLATAFAVVWVMFSYVSEFIPSDIKIDLKKSSESFRISIEDEEKLGDLMMDFYLEDETVVKSASLDAGLSLIYSRLLEGLQENQYQFKFYVVESDLINAMTFPGGNIVVNSALIEFSDSPEEFAAVIAHEIGHAQLRHVVDRFVAEMGMTVLVSLISGGDASVIHETVGALLSTAFSRSQESEADLFGMELLERSHIEPKSIGHFFKRLNEKDHSFDERLELLMSHPHNNSRIESSMQYEVKESFSSQPFAINWNHLKTSL